MFRSPAVGRLWDKTHAIPCQGKLRKHQSTWYEWARTPGTSQGLVQMRPRCLASQKLRPSFPPLQVWPKAGRGPRPAAQGTAATTLKRLRPSQEPEPEGRAGRLSAAPFLNARGKSPVQMAKLNSIVSNLVVTNFQFSFPHCAESVTGGPVHFEGLDAEGRRGLSVSGL